MNSVRGAGLLVNLRAWCHQWLWMTRLVSTRCGRRRIPTARHAATSVVYQCSYVLTPSSHFNAFIADLHA